MQTGTRISLPCHEIVLELGPEDPDRPGVYQGGRLIGGLDREEGLRELNAAMDAIEPLVLAHAVAGINVASSAYVEGIETTVETCRNHLNEPQGTAQAYSASPERSPIRRKIRATKLSRSRTGPSTPPKCPDLVAL